MRRCGAAAGAAALVRAREGGRRIPLERLEARSTRARDMAVHAEGQGAHPRRRSRVRSAAGDVLSGAGARGQLLLSAVETAVLGVHLPHARRSRTVPPRRGTAPPPGAGLPAARGLPRRRGGVERHRGGAAATSSISVTRFAISSSSSLAMRRPKAMLSYTSRWGKRA